MSDIAAKNTWPCELPNCIGPSFSLIPYSMIMLRTMPVACLEVTISACTNFTDEQLFGNTAAKKSCYFIQQFLLRLHHAIFAFFGSIMTYPPARPRGTIVTLCTISACSSIITNDRVSGFMISNNTLLTTH